jgi:hypothetical protein
MIKYLLYGIFLVTYFVVVSIGGGNNRQLTGISYPETPKNLTFEKDIKPIMNTYCGGIFCHHGKPSAWTRYKLVKLAIENGSFKKEVIDDRTMPKRKKIPQKEYDIIKKWLKEGAIEK